jgi:hypothetical protein
MNSLALKLPLDFDLLFAEGFSSGFDAATASSALSLFFFFPNINELLG